MLFRYRFKRLMILVMHYALKFAPAPASIKKSVPAAPIFLCDIVYLIRGFNQIVSLDEYLLSIASNQAL